MRSLVSHQCDTNLQTNSSLKYYNNVNRVLVLGTGIGLEPWGKVESRTRPRPWKYGIGLRQTPVLQHLHSMQVIKSFYIYEDVRKVVQALLISH